MLIQESIDLPFFPNVISGGKNMKSRREQFVGALKIDSYAARSVLRIGDCQVNSFGFDQRRDQLSNGPARRPSDHVSKDQNTHRNPFTWRSLPPAFHESPSPLSVQGMSSHSRFS